MNDNYLQQLLLETEVAPPQEAWEKIIVMLDELEEDKPLQQKILSAATEVPAFNWHIIEQRLEDRFYAEQLEQAEVAVPFTAWENINAQLDEEDDQRIAHQLIGATETPPAKIWSVIEHQLNEEQTGRIIPFKKNYTPVYRLAVAAAITGILAWGAYRLLNTNDPSAATVAAKQPVKTEEKKSVLIAELKKEKPVENIIPVSTPRTTIQKRIKEELSINNTVAYSEPTNHDAPIATSMKDAHHKNQKPAGEASGFSESQYLMVLNENGELIRVSKKLNNLECAKDGSEIPVDLTTALQSKNCDEQIKRWQQKIAASTAISPSAGYIDLGEILLATEK